MSKTLTRRAGPRAAARNLAQGRVLKIKTPAGVNKTIKQGDTITVVSDLFGRVRIKVSSANKAGVLGYPTSRRRKAPKTGMPVQGAVSANLREIRKGFRR